ncbi:hypothetical protein CCU_17010 [Coprococcus sp. ART55/1]|nr:hypothetical protein CCU_17010 [Coprococcus sp. ART55/1]
MDIIAEILFLLYKNQMKDVTTLLEKLNINREIQYTFKEI